MILLLYGQELPHVFRHGSLQMLPVLPLAPDSPGHANQELAYAREAPGSGSCSRRPVPDTPRPGRQAVRKERPPSPESAPPGNALSGPTIPGQAVSPEKPRGRRERTRGPNPPAPRHRPPPRKRVLGRRGITIFSIVCWEKMRRGLLRSNWPLQPLGN